MEIEPRVQGGAFVGDSRRVGTVDAVETVDGQRRYGLHYDEKPQDPYITTPGHDGAQLPPMAQIENTTVFPGSGAPPAVALRVAVGRGPRTHDRWLYLTLPPVLPTANQVPPN